MENLEKYRQRIDDALRLALPHFGEKTTLRDACDYALMSGGKRLRPTLVLMVAEALQHDLNVLPAALSVEYFHTASLIADDLPCMDNDDQRRNRPSLHKAFEESVALLASYTLIAAGYEGIYKNAGEMKANVLFKHRAGEATMRSLEIATRCAGIRGATGGQFLDLFPPDKSAETLRKIIAQKTGTLFQISFAFGWLFGGGASERLSEVEAAAGHLGMAFQIGDDLADEQQHAEETNAAAILGRIRAVALFNEEIGCFEKRMRALGSWTPAFEGIAAALQRQLTKA